MMQMMQDSSSQPTTVGNDNERYLDAVRALARRGVTVELSCPGGPCQWQFVWINAEKVVAISRGGEKDSDGRESSSTGLCIIDAINDIALWKAINVLAGDQTECGAAYYMLSKSLGITAM